VTLGFAGGALLAALAAAPATGSTLAPGLTAALTTRALATAALLSLLPVAGHPSTTLLVGHHSSVYRFLRLIMAGFDSSIVEGESYSLSARIQSDQVMQRTDECRRLG
jgi:hypothetical protein